MRLVDDAATTDFARAVGDSGPISVEGSKSRWSIGGALDPQARTVRAPAGVLEHRPEEMTVRVRAGTAVSDLHDRLAESGQRTALPDRGGTVGGAVAVGENDARVLGRGLLRSSVLQVTYVSSDGRVITGGGPTVKNVTGFDLPRLMVGALGTLGLLAEVILRTNPIPAVSVWVVATDADPFVAHAALYRPSAVLWDGARTWIELEGHAADVDAELCALAGPGSWEVTTGPPPLPPERWSLAPADLRSVDACDAGAFVASVGVGTVYASKTRPAPPMSPALRDLGARMKHAFDPNGRLNPGRDPARR